VQAAEAAGVENASVTTLVAILATALGVAKAAIMKTAPHSFIQSHAGISIELARETVMLPASLQPYAKALMLKLNADLA
jgi:hypothetical protein